MTKAVLGTLALAFLVFVAVPYLACPCAEGLPWALREPALVAVHRLSFHGIDLRCPRCLQPWMTAYWNAHGFKMD